MTLLLVFLGGAVGAPSRYLLDRWVQSRHGVRFPFGTLLINVLGCAVLGVIAGAVARHHWSADAQALLGTGFCGGLTTFSTFSVEGVELVQGKLAGRAAAYVVLSCALGIGAAALGYRVLT
ncbi:MAG TPA: fluoride efflux transporter CrcB [Jatrophihabitans sp.]|nr:fluoride efflux transporter CrcB [Jatrophihabitans sp.]